MIIVLYFSILHGFTFVDILRNNSAPTRSGIIFYANFRKLTANYPKIIVFYL